MSKILLVEDDNNLREIYEARLQAEGYDIVTARDGEEALVVAKAEKPDLIISDVMMPKVSGFEMLDILRNTEGMKEVKVIMLTALGQNDDQQRASRLGSDRYLVKSQVTLEDIVKVAHELLDDSTSSSGAATQPAEGPAPIEPAPPVAPPTEPPADSTPEATAVEPAVSVPAADPAPVEPPAQAPTPSDGTAATLPPAAAVAKDGAQSTDQEEASVEAKIEDFVAGATTDASPPANPPAASDEPTSQPAATTTASASSTDDKLMTQAVDNLMADVEPKVVTPAAPAGAAAGTTTVTPTVQPVSTTEDKEEKASSDGPVQVAHKKVITPIDSAPKADLDELLAVEAAKEAAAAPSVEPTPVVSNSDKATAPTPKITAAAPASTVVPDVDEDAPSGAPVKPPSAAAAPEANNTADPGSIAL